MYVIMGLVCRFKAPGGGFSTREIKHVQIVGNSKIYFTILMYFYHHVVALRCVAARACAKQAAWDPRIQICIESCIPEMPLCRS